MKNITESFVFLFTHSYIISNVLGLCFQIRCTTVSDGILLILEVKFLCAHCASRLLTGLWTGRDARATGCVEEGPRGMCSEGLVCSPVVLTLGPAVTLLSPLSEDSLSDTKPTQTGTDTRAEFSH